jgi:hypothetical protein
MPESFSDDQFRQLQKEIRESIRRNHPNPDRVGCPGNTVLQKVARRELAPGDPSYSHVMECSPCYEELMTIGEQIDAERASRNSRKRKAFAIASALAFLFVVIGFISYKRIHQPSDTGSSVAVLNFESESALRGQSDIERPGGELQRVPRKRLTLKIFLPLGLDRGEYEVKLSQDEIQPVFQSSGTATMQDGLTSLTLSADLTKLPAGRYHLAFRRNGETWRFRDIVLY